MCYITFKRMCSVTALLSYEVMNCVARRVTPTSAFAIPTLTQTTLKGALNALHITRIRLNGTLNMLHNKYYNLADTFIRLSCRPSFPNVSSTMTGSYCLGATARGWNYSNCIINMYTYPYTILKTFFFSVELVNAWM